MSFRKIFGGKSKATKSDSNDDSRAMGAPFQAPIQSFDPTAMIPSNPAPRQPYDPKAKPANFDSTDYRPGGEDRVEVNQPILNKVNTVVLFDDSGSMVGANWALCRKVLPVFIDAIMRNDYDGIDWYWLNLKSKEEGDPEAGLPGSGYNGIQNPDYILNLFENRPLPTNRDLTYSGKRLYKILDCYVSLCERRHKKREPLPKPLSIIFFTDGDATDKAFLRARMVEIVKRLDAIKAPRRQCGIQLFQVFDPSWMQNEELAEYLRGIERHLKDLDDGILDDCEGSKRDMIDRKLLNDIIKNGGFTADSLVRVLCGALIARFDAEESAVQPN